MPNFAAQMTLNMVTNISADAVVNTLHFQETSSAVAVPEIITMMSDFYDDLQAVYSASVRQNGHTLKIYDLSLPSPNYPISETTYNFASAPTGATLPHENAVCMSFQAPRVSGTAQARRRGRIYIGPLKTSAVVAGGFIGSGVYNAVRLAGENLLIASGAATTDWVAYSPTLGTGTAVDNGWVDDAFDTQRRRGTDPTVRVTF